MQRNKNNKNTLNQWTQNNNNNNKNTKNENSNTVNSNKVTNCSCNFCYGKSNNGDCCEKTLDKKNNRNVTNLICKTGNVTNLICENGNVTNLICKNGNVTNLICDCCNGKVRSAVAVSCCDAQLCRRFVCLFDCLFVCLLQLFSFFVCSNYFVCVAVSCYGE